MQSSIYVFAVVLLLLNCNKNMQVASDQNVAETSKTVLTTTLDNDDPEGTWEIVTDTPRGKRTAEVRIVAEDDGLMGYAERGDFKITQEGNQLKWTSRMNSPRGAITMSNVAELANGSMTGQAKMISGPMEGKVFTFTGRRIAE